MPLTGQESLSESVPFVQLILSTQAIKEIQFLERDQGESWMQPFRKHFCLYIKQQTSVLKSEANTEGLLF